MLDREKYLQLLIKPLQPSHFIADRAAPVSAGVIHNRIRMMFRTAVQPASQFDSAAVYDLPEGCIQLGYQGLIPDAGIVLYKDIENFTAHAEDTMSSYSCCFKFWADL